MKTDRFPEGFNYAAATMIDECRAFDLLVYEPGQKEQMLSRLLLAPLQRLQMVATKIV